MSLKITDSLRRLLAQSYYREACDQDGWAYISLEDLNIGDNNLVVFFKGSHKVSVRLPAQVISEIREFSKLDLKGRPVFDYLACKVRHQDRYENIMFANPTALTWVQVRTSRSEFSDKEVEVLERIKIPLALFYVRNVLVQPQKIEVEWDIRTGDEWLDELDEKRDQVESDDDYL